MLPRKTPETGAPLQAIECNPVSGVQECLEALRQRLRLVVVQHVAGGREHVLVDARDDGQALLYVESHRGEPPQSEAF